MMTRWFGASRPPRRCRCLLVSGMAMSLVPAACCHDGGGGEEASRFTLQRLVGTRKAGATQLRQPHLARAPGTVVVGGWRSGALAARVGDTSGKPHITRRRTSRAGALALSATHLAMVGVDLGGRLLAKGSGSLDPCAVSGGPR